MEFRILGPVEVRDGGRLVPLGSGQQRALLAVLLLQANETVSRDRLIHELWGERPPATAVKALQGHVSALRRLLEPERIVTRGAGYSLRVEEGELDVARFERLRDEGRLREALALWHGPPLADVDGEFARLEAPRLAELRAATVEDRIEADLASGRHADLVGELEALVAASPLRERLRGQLMLALYRSGRQAEALAAYQDGRRVLVDELGLEPGRELQELERAILRQDPSLDLPAAPATPERTLVGRERELGFLRQALDEALAGRGSLVLVAGEAGIGKSRLADELAQLARERGATTLFGRAWEAGGAPAYWPWAQAIRSYARRRDPTLVRERLGAGAADVAQMLPELRETLPDVGPPVSLDPEGARFRLFDATATFLRSAAEAEPLVLVLDDLHAADASSLLLLEFVARELDGMHVLVLGCYRESEAPAMGELRRQARSTLSLGGLAEADVGRMVEVEHGLEPRPDLVAAIHRETDGNPFFVGEILKLLAAEGRLGDDPGLDARIPIPPSVRDAIRRRLRHLSDECLRALVLAAVLGREFDLNALARSSGRDLDAVLEVLDEAIAGGVVAEVPGAQGRLRFVHVLIRDALYDELPATRRLRLHGDVGEALEALYAANPEPHLAELAHHFRQAVPVADAERAVRYATRAGDRAALLLAYEEAARLYVAALELVEAGSESCELQLRLGDVQARQGDIAASKETFVRAADTARAARLPEHLARAALGYGGRFVWARAWGDERLVPLLEEAVAALPDQDSELRARLLARLSGGPYRDTLPTEPRERMAQEAVEMARRLGDPATLAYTLEGRYDANWGPDALAGRLAIADELLALAAAVGDAERAYAGHDCRFIAMLEAGNLAEARQSHAIGARHADQLRQPAQLWDSAARRGLLALYEGRLVDAESATREAFAIGRSVQTVNAQLVLELQLYALRREQGRLSELVDVVERAVDDYPGYPVWRYVLIDVLAELGRTADARTELARAGVEGYPVYLEMQWLFSMNLLGDACRALDDADTAEVIYARLLPYAHFNAVLAPELCFGSVSRALGNLAATASRVDDAVGHLEDALATNAAGGSGTWLAHTQYDLARTLLERDGVDDRLRADELLTAARASADAMGLRALAARIP